jgi:hypothetical protein
MLDAECAGRVNAGVIRAWKLRHATVRKYSAEWHAATLKRSNKRLDPTGISLSFIENYSVPQLSPGGSIAALCRFAESWLLYIKCYGL